MTQDKINQMFEGRWRMKRYILENIDGKAAKEIARDFFEAGVMLGDKDCVVNPPGTIVVVDYDRLAPPPNMSLFEWWWDMYDKKIDRAKCEKKFEKLTPEEKKACIKATPAYVASTPDIKFRRHPMTYLNNKSWENQIIPRNGTEQPTVEQQRKDKLTSILVD